ncbi:T9SS type A sorting domain-containing protein [Flavobacterium paronense]|uniref:T9SS type A sorting domain-containing protein n=1 Tax=Flavobacterium paronense TaxID=1392775 RepID=A0ABV5GGB8_9FLAO|nr:T9SS type A sorting domain-containing protein [Flavobacterium paronense]MDN3677065.1 T9SS type A sorting domain-containing protein [Flavobacterium paronense]
MKKLYSLLFFAISIFTNAQIIDFPDANFKTKLLEASASNQIAIDLAGNYNKIDINDNGEIEQSEALQVLVLNVSNTSITNLSGINYFVNLGTLYCANNPLTSLDLTSLVNLTGLNCANDLLTTLNVSGLTNLWELYCFNNQLTSLNLNGFSNLHLLYCSSNLLQDLQVNDLVNLNILQCQNNQLPSLNLSGLVNINSLICFNNQLTTINLSGLVSLRDFMCSQNLLPEINLNDSPHLRTMYCNDNQLISLFVKTGSPNIDLDIRFNNNPGIQFICTDDALVESFQYFCTLYGYTNCAVSSYCSFVPGGDYYIIEGNSKFDETNNGCDSTDLNMSYLKFTISDGIETGTLIANETGNYSIPVSSGTHTITPVLENPTYFTVSPAVSNVTFPTSVTPFVQDFCLSANGIHNDLEITLLPTSAARPGFDATYKIIYKNKGTSAQSGTVSLDYYNPIEDFIAANPSVTNESSGFFNTLNWNFSNLLPFESREITVTFNLNSPLETPPLNSGNLIDYNARIVGATDETQTDNVSSITQTIVNSFDPNDKTCTEGYSLPLYKLGDYLHYIIRFENTGTAIAENIVVSDVIDTTKFDINTLIPIGGRHSFETRILSTNKVEFIFQHINLPFDDANNDGFVAFKIKTLPTLTDGQIIDNSANIYFDYNVPILTNTYSVNVFNPLSNPDFVFSNVYNLSPVPAKNNLTITTKQNVMISSVSIYNTLGQLVQVNTNPNETIDVSGLKTGNYFIKIVSDKVTASSKFVKE